MLVKELKNLLNGICYFHVYDPLFDLGSDETAGEFFQYVVVVDGETVPSILYDYKVAVIGTQDTNLLKDKGIHIYIGQSDSAVAYCLKELAQKTINKQIKKEYLLNMPSIMVEERKPYTKLAKEFSKTPTLM